MYNKDMHGDGKESPQHVRRDLSFADCTVMGEGGILALLGQEVDISLVL